MVVPLKKPKKRKIVYKTPQIFLPPAQAHLSHNCSKCNTVLCENCHHDLSPKKKTPKKKKKPVEKVTEPPSPVPEPIPAVEIELSPKPCEKCIEHDEEEKLRLEKEEADRLLK